MNVQHLLDMIATGEGSGQHTMRELGNVFQLRRRPSLSSISLHWSLSASKSAMMDGCEASRYVETIGRRECCSRATLVLEGRTEGAHDR